MAVSTTFEIHPAIGIARAGTSAEFFIGPEPGSASPSKYRDAGGDLLRQAARYCDRSEPVAGESWLTVGDAAAAHDPIAGQGILWALESGIAGAEAILTSTAGAYATAIGERFERYLATRAAYYGLEDRWPDAPFWRRRRAWNHAPT